MGYNKKFNKNIWFRKRYPEQKKTVIIESPIINQPVVNNPVVNKPKCGWLKRMLLKWLG